jgi:hypothetical protein
MQDRIDEILATRPVSRDEGDEIGRSREGRPIRASRFGSGKRRVSLIAGCHADEPVGPRLLRHLVAYLSSVSPADPALERYQWWIVPHINPDGEEWNRAWYDDDDLQYDLVEYLTHVVRELPGDDIEFGFPRDHDDRDTRPENRAVSDWWRLAGGAFDLHVSLHGMAFAAGPWFLIEEAWKDRSEHLKERCVTRVNELGYVLHDVDRRGEKGFFRLGRGFCTRPDSRYMREHFVQHDGETAALFRPSSMEAIRSLGGDPLTLVSEMPLFITPGVGEQLGPPDPVARGWKERIDGWRAQVHLKDGPRAVAAAAEAGGLWPMPVRDQMMLQWAFVTAGLEQVELDVGGRAG